MVLLTLGGLVIVALAAGAAMLLFRPAPPPALTLTWAASCPFPLPSGEHARCGMARAPALRDHPDQGSIEFFVAELQATGPSPQPDPVVLLNGGPGQAGSDLIEGSWKALAEIRRERALIFVDQRGAGRSRPALFCPELDPVAFWHGGLTAEDARACLRPIQNAGLSPAAFNTIDSALDLVDLRRALGYQRWNLLGTSYGTILAMETLRRDPEGVRAVVLNSPTLTAASWLDLNRMAAIKAVYRKIFAACQAQPACDRAYPGLEQVFLDLARRLNAAPLEVRYTDPRTGQPGAGKMSFARLLDILTVMAGSGSGSAQVPALLWYLHQVSTGKAEPWAPLLAWLYMPYWKTMDGLAYGLNAAIGCREVRPWVDASGARSNALLYQPYVQPLEMETDYDVFCPVWNLPRGPEELRTPVASPVPVLLLTGELDTLTPTTLADTIARTLPHAQILRFAGLGHDVLSASSCAHQALANFVDTPTAQLVLPCLAEARMPEFVIRQDLAPATVEGGR